MRKLTICHIRIYKQKNLVILFFNALLNKAIFFPFKHSKKIQNLLKHSKKFKITLFFFLKKKHILKTTNRYKFS